jgi:MFS family permease
MFSPHARLYLAGFILDFAIMTAITVIPFYVYNQLGGTELMSGVIGGIQAVCYAATCLVSSRFVGRTRHGLRWAYAGLLIYLLLMPFMLLSRNPWVAGGVSVVAWGGLAFVWPAFYSWIGADPDAARRQKSLGWFNIAWSGGFTVSPLFAGPLYDHAYWLPFVVVSAGTGLALLLVVSLPRERDYFGAPAHEDADDDTAIDWKSEAFLYAAWMATLVANMILGVMRSVYPKRVNDLVAAGDLRIFFEEVPAGFLTVDAATKYSWLAFACSLFTVLIFLYFGHSTVWRHKLGWLIGIQVAAGAAFWALATTTSLAVMLVAFALAGAALGVGFFSSVYYSVANPRLKHRRAAINEGAVGVGGCLGSIVFGYLASVYGMAFPFQWSPLFIAAAILFQFWLVRHGARRVARMQHGE